jgi:hypothetical protein
VFVRPFQVTKHLKGPVGAPVVDEKEFIPDVHPAEGRAELLVEFLERFLLVVEGDDDAQIGPLGLVLPMLLRALLLGAPLLVLLLRGCRRSLGLLPGLRRFGCLVGHRCGIPVELRWS